MRPRLILCLAFIGVAVVGALWFLREPDEQSDSVATASVLPPPAVAKAMADKPDEPRPSPQAAQSVTPPADPETRLRETARTLARTDLASAATWLLTLSDTDAAIATDAVLAELGRDDVPSALALAHALRRGVDDGRVEHVAQIWTEEDPAAAVAWIANLSPGADRDRLLARAALVRVGQDPAEAALLLDAMTPGPARDDALAATIARLKIYDSSKAATWQAILARS